MFTGATKIVKPEGQDADEFEQTVAQELFNLEVSARMVLVASNVGKDGRNVSRPVYG